MLNLGDLGSNYLPSIHIVPKLHFVQGFDGKEDFKSDFKEDLRFEEVSSTKNSKAEENRARHGRAP